MVKKSDGIPYISGYQIPPTYHEIKINNNNIEIPRLLLILIGTINLVI